MNFDFFKQKTVPLIGIDISSSSVKMVELTATANSRFRLEAYSTTGLPVDSVVDGNIAKLDLLIEAVEKGWKDLATSKKNVALALPASSVITKKIFMPYGLTEDEMTTQVQFEASQFIPFALDEVNIDFYASDDPPNHHNEIEVLIVASRKEKVEDRVAAVEGAGLKAMVVDVDSYAVEAALTLAPALLLNQGRNQTLMMIDVGANTMKINVLHDYVSVYTHEQAFGGAKLTQDIRRHFNLSMEEAEAAKKAGTLPASYISEVYQPFLKLFAMEVSRAVQLFTNATQYTRVDQVVLIGGCASMEGLQELVAERSKINTIVFNPFNTMALGSRIDQTQLLKDAPRLMVACGLAMRGFE